VVLGPVRTTDLYDGGKLVPTPLLDGAVNRTVRHLGVDRGAVSDEFDALGLGRHRSNEKWLAAAGEPGPGATGATTTRTGSTAASRRTRPDVRPRRTRFSSHSRRPAMPRRKDSSAG
jgi:hypothetical protein